MNLKDDKTIEPIYVVSGGRGIAGNNIVQAVLIQYPDNKIPVKIVSNMDNEDDLFDVVMKAKTDGGIIVHTLVNGVLREKLQELCAEFRVREVDLMGKLAGFLNETLNIKPLMHPGLYREINHQYFDRIESIEFTLSHDDGMSPERLNNAEIILTGQEKHRSAFTWLCMVGKWPMFLW